jgi:hypothetical protein
MIKKDYARAKRFHVCRNFSAFCRLQKNFKHMKLKLLFSLLFFFVFHFNVNAQDYIDCINAVQVCDNDPAEYSFSTSFGQVDEGLTLCAGYENLFPDYFEEGTIWLEYNFSLAGEFAFTIFPSDPSIDVDFVVFESSTNSCDDLIPIRCMFTGENIGGPIDSMCIGPTGLSLSSVDTLEEVGCGDNDDNFLASVSVNEGDVLFVAVKNFSLEEDTFLIEYTGDAEIGCITSSSNLTEGDQIRLSPNPTSGYFTIDHLMENSKVEVFTPLGVSVFQTTAKQTLDIDLSHQMAGLYYVKISNIASQKNSVIRKILKLD